ncbi:hypothetical protein HU200_032981 [Digitaria exilis]|uniref:Uncharacterized protein n=1 Tax=Digitaria exilis TaxID=1010633 RepID=A0A835BMQ2_9POAL|nr:hypothetical protein HU200_032981 [Digitaria exilis]
MDHLNNTMDSSAMDMPEGARAPKARKPYTISKQREKWTEDEHKLFLEALQQHGRAWRRIQEHIGSKTAVQIRSHAQKFFSKVIRESSGDSNSIAAPPQIHIPPPRPKRKPAHPYPRKLGNSLGKDASAIKKLEKVRLKMQFLSEQENCSPKSVLGTAQIGSETLATEGSGSPTSSVYLEEKCLTPSTSVGESADDTTSNGEMFGIPEGPVLRLFGKRVVVNDLHQQSNSDSGLQNAADMELDASAQTPTSGTGKFSSHGEEEAKTWSPWLAGTQQFMYYLPQGYGNGSMPYTELNPQTVASNTQQHQPSQAADCNSTSVPETTQNSDSTESTRVNNNDEEVIPVPGSRKRLSTVPVHLQGFMPYKKCTAAQSKMLQSQAPGKDEDMTRLCL